MNNSPSSLEQLVLEEDMTGANLSSPESIDKEIYREAPSGGDPAARDTLAKQFDDLRTRVNGFLDLHKGKKKIQKKVIIKIPYRAPVARSWENAFGLLWYFGFPREVSGVRMEQKVVEETVERNSDEGIDELQSIVDSYISMYRQYAAQIKDLCRNHILKAFRETTEIKIKYYGEILEARNRAIADSTLKASIVGDYEALEKQFRQLDPQSEQAARMEATLDLLNLRISRYTNSCIMATKEAGYKREHANMLKFVEYGLYLIYQTAHNSARIVLEFVRQLEHMRMFSVPSTKTIRDLVTMDEKISEGKPYLTQSNELLMKLLGCAFGNYNGFSQASTGDVSKILDGIKQFHERSQRHYAATSQVLDRLKRPEEYVSAGNYTPQAKDEKNELDLAI